MLHHIDPHKYHSAYLPRQPVCERDYLLRFSNEQIMVKRKNGVLVLPLISDWPDEQRCLGSLTYLFSVDGSAFFCCPHNMQARQIENANSRNGELLLMPVRSLREFEPSWLAFAAITAYHLNHWYTRNRYCGACGSKFEQVVEERVLLCRSCGYQKYPEIAMAVIVGISDGDKLLLTKYADRPYKNYALIAGFVEIGESLEDAIRREVAEETGLKVRNIRYFASQPWGFSCSLLAGFFAEVDGATNIVLDRRELSEAVWVKREDIPSEPTPISLTATMMTAFKDISNETS
ncbi:MAG: NAD(+) diphosphatase [Clostridiales bacterium]|nr:NAD(+) diphosphatase [Clostridiales bacterium]